MVFHKSLSWRMRGRKGRDGSRERDRNYQEMTLTAWTTTSCLQSFTTSQPDRFPPQITSPTSKIFNGQRAVKGRMQDGICSLLSLLSLPSPLTTDSKMNSVFNRFYGFHFFNANRTLPTYTYPSLFFFLLMPLPILNLRTSEIHLFYNLSVNSLIYLSNPLSFSPFWLLLFSFHNFRSQKGLEKDWIRNQINKRELNFSKNTIINPSNLLFHFPFRRLLLGFILYF